MLAESDAGGAPEKGAKPMFEEIVFAAAAVATVAGFLLEVWREIKSKSRADDEGKKEETGRDSYRS